MDRSARLCRPVLRKASGFPASAVATVLHRAGWKAQPSSQLGGGSSGHALREGRAFPHDRRRSRRSSLTGWSVIWASLYGHAPLQESSLR